MFKVSLEGDPSVDYIYCLDYIDVKAVQNSFHPIEVTDTTVSCNLDQRQRSSQQILDLADYLNMHSNYFLMRRYDDSKSFSSEIPLWIEIANPKSFFECFKFASDDVMVIHQRPSNINAIEEFCRLQKWRCTSKINARGSEASVTILYDLQFVWHDLLTRAKTQLVIVTIDGKQRYFLLFQSCFVS